MLKNYLVERITSGKEPQVLKKGCLNQRKGQQGCRLCLDACPTKALTWRGNISIDGTACDGCNICTALCPPQALRAAGVSYRELLLEAGGERPSLLLTCREHPLPGARISVPCLAGLHWEFIAALALAAGGKKLLFYLADCGSCFRESSLWVLHESLKKAGVFLEALNHPANIEKIAGKDFSPPGESREISRREWFSLCRAGLFKTIDTVLDDFMNEHKEDAFSEQRRCMAEVVNTERGFYLEEGNLPFSNWRVGDACSGCGFCRGICPRGAWETDMKGEFSVLSHSPWQCVSCGLCASLCPQKAISAAPWSKLPARGQQINKKTLSLQKCRRCSLQIPIAKSGGLCGSCKKKELLKKGLS